MPGTLIAFVDGSIYSESVCEYTAWMAGRMQAELVKLYHVIGRPQTAGRGDLSGAIRLGARTRLLEQLSDLDAQRARLAQAQGRAILEDAKALVESADAGGADVVVRLRHGDIVETIAEKAPQADVVVIGKRGDAADFEKLTLGSNVEAAVRASRTPVFIASRAFRAPEHVLIAHDGGASSQKAVDHVARDPLFAGMEITVATVGDAAPERRKGLETARQTLAAGGHDARTVLLAGRPATAIGNYVERRGIGLTVMGAYSHSRLRNIVMGSTTAETIRTCKTSVLLMR